MPRRTSSPTMLIVNFFMSAPVAEAKQALDTAKAIVSSREAAGLVQPSLPNAPKPRKRRGANKPKQADLPVPGSPAATAGSTTGPVAVPDAPKPRRRRGAGARPAVADTAAAATAAAPLPAVPAGVDLASLPAPTE